MIVLQLQMLSELGSKVTPMKYIHIKTGSKVTPVPLFRIIFQRVAIQLNDDVYI